MPSSTSSLPYRVFVNVISTLLCGVNSSRDLLIIHNESGVLFVHLGSYASPTQYTYRLTPHTTVEIPSYIGAVSAIKEVGPSYVQLTEIQ